MRKSIVTAALVACIVVLCIRRAPPKGERPVPGSRSLQAKIQMIRQLLCICVPGLLSIEHLTIGVLIFLLVLRTRLLLQSAHSRSVHAKLLVQGETSLFLRGIVDIGLWAVPRAVIDSATTYVASRLTQQFRKNIQTFIHEQLLSTNGFAAVDVSSTTSLDNPEHRMTHDTMMFCYHSVDCFTSLCGPSIDVVLLLARLYTSSNVLPPALIAAYYSAMGAFLARVVPNSIELQSVVQEREADYRRIHTQLATHAEEVAFYRGESIERDNCNKRLDAVVRKHVVLANKKANIDVVESLLAKYGATVIGYAVCAIPVFGLPQNIDPTERTSTYVLHQQLYVPLAHAIGKMMRINQRFAQLASSATRVGGLLQFMQTLSCHSCERQRTHVAEPVRSSPHIVLNNVSIRAPPTNGRLLFEGVTCTVSPHCSLLVTGGTGVGKSALLSAMAGMLPVDAGTLTFPSSGVMMSPQRALLPTGTMKQLLTYPDTNETVIAKGATDLEIVCIAERVGLGSVLNRFHGDLNTERRWVDLLSGGEGQRVALARVLYHRPMFALLDDCTNALTQDDEVSLLEELQRDGITLITVSHRASLRRLHTSVLCLDDYKPV